MAVRWALNRSAFDRLLETLHPDRERAGELYERVRYRLIKFFEHRGCPLPEEPADETIDRVARRLEGGEVIQAADPSHYFYGVARNVLWERMSAPELRWRSLEELVRAEPAEASTLPDEEAEGLMECLERCLDTLAPAQRELLSAYYEWGRQERIGRRRELAKARGLSLTALRLRVHRLRLALEACVTACREKGGQRNGNGPETTPQGRDEA